MCLSVAPDPSRKRSPPAGPRAITEPDRLPEVCRLECGKLCASSCRVHAEERRRDDQRIQRPPEQNDDAIPVIHGDANDQVLAHRGGHGVQEVVQRQESDLGFGRDDDPKDGAQGSRAAAADAVMDDQAMVALQPEERVGLEDELEVFGAGCEPKLPLGPHPLPHTLDAIHQFRTGRQGCASLVAPADEDEHRLSHRRFPKSRQSSVVRLVDGW
jgi:hypothetical protein